MSARPAPHPLLKGLYLILDPAVRADRPLEEVLQEAAAHGARLFQYRDKLSPMGEAYRRAMALRRAAAETGSLLIVNDRCDLALAVDADGVHLGQEDVPLPHARSLLGAGKIIGVSTHRPEQVEEATEGGADYVGFGPIFPTGTKSQHDPVVGLDGLRAIRPLTDLPVFAIGGITIESVDAIMRAGADGVAVISAVLAASDIGQAVRTFIARLPAADRPAS
ncbi:MAG TPA: thiamine phosphate synthase [Nitrospiraceae bacterium]|jgi:thiamine-phosphate pyrophosphorylase|nr:thiamine phosphate synthase [Nitrospiraceae bacterium]